MTTQNHRYAHDPQYASEFDEERLKLETVLDAIRAGILRRQAQIPVAAVDVRTANAVEERLESLNDSYREAEKQPYFGRVDFFILEEPPAESAGDDIPEEDGFDEKYSTDYQPPETQEERNKRLSQSIYIGVAHIEGQNVSSWTVPVARLWYVPDAEGYGAPKGYIQVQKDLVRHLQIRNQQLMGFSDTYRRQLPAGGQTRHDVLTGALSNTADGHLSVIIETIQPNQYYAIANVADRVLVVQGAAGSGKSEIGLHRIAYLLSPFNDLPPEQRPTPETTLFIAPSRYFLDYAADLLPGLNVQRGVRQMTLRQWIDSNLSFRLARRPDTWNDLLNNGRPTRFSEPVESFKSSMAMAGAIERYYRSLVSDTRRAVRSASALSVPQNRPDSKEAVVISQQHIRQIADALFTQQARQQALNTLREEFTNRVMSLVWETGKYGQHYSGLEALQVRQQIQANGVTAWLNDIWPHHTAPDIYETMFADAGQAQSLVKESLSETDTALLSESVRRGRQNGFQDSDVAPIAYLDHLLNGTVAATYRHIVVDEAQDISPIEFKLLSLSSNNNWFTILGDTVQRLTPHRGLRRWADLNRVLGRDNIKVQEARTSYRSTKQITRFSNRLLRLFDKNIKAPLPFQRDGHRPEYHIHSNRDNMYRIIVSELGRIRSLNGLNDARIAVLCRDRQNLSAFERFFREQRCAIDVFGKDDSANSRTVLARIPDVKGLEYDAVIVFGVNESFADTTFNQKLLYVAATRAKHYLAFHWANRQSPILRQIYDGGVQTIDHRQEA